MPSSTIVQPPDASLQSALRLSLAFAALKLLLHFALTIYTTHLGYGYFRDEFYYLACGHHLAWGYVDHGPIVALQARLGELLFGDSIFGIRVLSALAGAATIFLGGMITWALGGRRSAQALAMLGLLIAPELLGLDGFLSMNSFEPVFWATCVLTLLLMLNGRWSQRAWILFGITAGVGILNKPSMAVFLFAIGLGLLCTPSRRILFSRYAALGIAILILIPVPFLLWHIHNHWPTLEFLHNGKVEGKNTILNPLQFFLAQLSMMHPVNALLWITGIVALLRARSIPIARWYGLTYLFFFGLMCALHAKDYYLTGSYTPLFAAGAVAWEHRYRTTRAVARGSIFAFPVFESVLLITGAPVLPMASPVLKPDTWSRYTTATHLAPGNTETQQTSILPQFFADRFGWEEFAAKVTAAYRSLPPQQQAHACILARNYGEAGAIEFFNRRDHLGLPPVVSGHNNYWLWGAQGCTGQTWIAITSGHPEDFRDTFHTIIPAGHIDSAFIMPYEHRNIYILTDRDPKQPFDWAAQKGYI